MEDIIILYGNIKKNSVINHFNNIIIDENNDKGYFKLDKDTLKIVWDTNNSEENFILVDSKNNINIYNFTENNLEEFDLLKNDNISNHFYINNFLIIQYHDLKEEAYIKMNEKNYLKSLYERELNLYYYNDNKIVNDIFLINNYTKNIYPINNKYNDCGTFILVNDILNIYWNNNTNDQFNILHQNNKYYSEYLLNNIFQKILIKICDDNDTVNTYLLNSNNFEIFNNNITYKYKYIDEFKIQINNNIYELNDENIYCDVTSKYIEEIEITHNEWSDKCIIHKLNNNLYRLNDQNEYGTYEFFENNIIIFWEKWDSEVFMKNDNIYYYKEKYDKNNYVLEFNIIHSDWSDTCIIYDNKIHRKNMNDEFGKYVLENNKLIIFWEKWNENIFYKCDNIFYLESFINFMMINNVKYIINKFNNKIYDIEYNCIGNFEMDNIYINVIIDNISNMYYYKLEENNIILYHDIFKDIILHKYLDETYTLNILTNELIDNNNSKIGYLNLNEYKLYNNKYYYRKYFELHEKEIYLINKNFDNINNSNYYFNYVDNYIYNNLIKIKYLQNDTIYYIIINDKLYKYHLLKIKSILDEYYIFLIDSLYDIIDEKNINLELYINFNKELNNLSNIELIFHLFQYGITQNKIYSINSFMRKYNFFDIDNYRKNNNIENSEDAIMHWYNYGLVNKFFYSNENIEIIYNNLLISDENNEISIDDDMYNLIFDEYDNLLINDKYLFNDDDFNVIYCLNNNFYDKTIFVINLKDFVDIHILLEQIPKNSHMIININFKNDIIKYDNIDCIIKYDNIDCIINNYKNLLITKSNNKNNYTIINYILKLLNNDKYDNIIYISNNSIDIDEIFEKDIFSTNDEIILLDDNHTKIQFILFECILVYECTSVYEIILTIIFRYIIQRNIFNLNFIGNISLIKKLMVI